MPYLDWYLLCHNLIIGWTHKQAFLIVNGLFYTCIMSKFGQIALSNPAQPYFFNLQFDCGHCGCIYLSYCEWAFNRCVYIYLYPLQCHILWFYSFALSSFVSTCGSICRILQCHILVSIALPYYHFASIFGSICCQSMYRLNLMLSVGCFTHWMYCYGQLGSLDFFYIIIFYSSVYTLI